MELGSPFRSMAILRDALSLIHYHIAFAFSEIDYEKNEDVSVSLVQNEKWSVGVIRIEFPSNVDSKFVMDYAAKLQDKGLRAREFLSDGEANPMVDIALFETIIDMADHERGRKSN